MTKNEADTLYNAGYELRETLGGFKKALPKAEQLNYFLNNDLDRFFYNVFDLHNQNSMMIPEEILKAKDDIIYGQAYILGMLGDEKVINE